MPDLLRLTGAAIADYQNHLGEFPNTDPVIFAYLTRHINGLMCAEIEQVVTRLIRERLERGCRDEATANFLKSLRRSSIRNATVSEIRDAMKLFGDDHRTKFNDLLDQAAVNEESIGKLGMAVGNRDQDAHESPPNITFRELEEAYVVATAVMDAVRLTLET